MSDASAIRASVVIPVWNRQTTVRRAIDSLLAQTCPHLEVIVVDNGSTDSSCDVALSSGDPRVRLIRLAENTGPSGARNAGAAAAAGPVLGFLDSDDEVVPEWLASLLAPFDDVDCAAVTCADSIFPSDPDGPQLVVFPSDMGPAFYRIRGRFRAGSFLLRTEVFSAIGGYSEELWFAESTEMTFRLAAWCHAYGKSVKSIERPLSIWHRGSESRYDMHLDRILFAAEYTIRKHLPQLSLDRRLLANQFSVAGHCLVRLGRRRDARKYFRRALVLQPMRPVHAARWIAASSELTTRLAWRR